VQKRKPKQPKIDAKSRERKCGSWGRAANSLSVNYGLCENTVANYWRAWKNHKNRPYRLKLNLSKR